MEYLFVNKQPRILGLCTGHRLMPKRNMIEMSEAQYALATQNRHFQHWQKVGWVAVGPQATVEAPAQEASLSEEQIAALDSKNVKKSIALIEACSNQELLAQWHERDQRSTVKQAIEERIGVLEGEVAPGTPGQDDMPPGVDEVFGDNAKE